MDLKVEVVEATHRLEEAEMVMWVAEKQQRVEIVVAVRRQVAEILAVAMVVNRPEVVVH